MTARFYVRVGGDFACFTDPNLKVERVSYPVMTPGAARGLLEAIFWKPAFRWEIREIKVMKPIKTLSVMRNEIEDRQGGEPIVIEKKRQQRVSLILKEVEYVIAADIAMVWKQERIEKYIEQFERKLARGAYHHTPYLGTREFAAWFEPASGKEQPAGVITTELGQMLFDTAYVPSSARPNIRFHRHSFASDPDEKSNPAVEQGYQHYLFFDAALNKSCLIVPPEKYQELYALEGIHV